MEKREAREQLKHNFLKNLLFRIDFNGLLETDIENFIVSIREHLMDRGYVDLKETFESSLNMASIPELDTMPTNKETQKVYVFSSDTGKELKIWKSGIIFDIDIEKNETLFSYYIPLISYLIEQLKKLSYVNYTRIGLRKINSCIFLTKEEAYNSFEQNVFCKFSDQSVSTIIEDQLHYENVQINYKRALKQGILMMDEKQKIGYQIILDIDASIHEYSVLNHTLKEKKPKDILNKLNDLIFDVYINSLTTDFIDNLKQEKFDMDSILEVNRNV